MQVVFTVITADGTSYTSQPTGGSEANMSELINSLKFPLESFQITLPDGTIVFFQNQCIQNSVIRVKVL